MAFPIDDRDGLALRFADFEMLPDLLRLVEMRPGEDPRPAWLREIAGADINTDHIEDDNEGRAGGHCRRRAAPGGWT